MFTFNLPATMGSTPVVSSPSLPLTTRPDSPPGLSSVNCRCPGSIWMLLKC
jgi:hypothetical protein